jgi:capsular exopolysaccharide synthesis family protein
VVSLRRLSGRVGRYSHAGGEIANFDESFRVLRSNLTVAISDLAEPTVIVTSAEAEEGKTLVCTNLAMSFAVAGQRVVLVDLDLRHPNAHKLIGAHNEFGVTDVLLGRRTLEDCLQYVELPGLGRGGSTGMYFLATGNPVANPAELLGMSRTARMLDGLARQADLVLLDTPPVLPVADTLVIGRMAAGALLVLETKRTTFDAIAKSKDLLIRNQTRLLGVVLNKFQDYEGPRSYGLPYGYDVSQVPPSGSLGVDLDPTEAGLKAAGSVRNGNGRTRDRDS